MACYETTIQHLEGEMNGPTLERTGKLEKNLKELANKAVRNLQTYRGEVQQREEETHRLTMRSVKQDSKQHQRLKTTRETSISWRRPIGG